MAKCEVCGNEYDKSFEVMVGDQKHVFDSFECAMSAFAPHCGTCGCKLTGQAVVLGDTIYCSYACASGAYIHDYEHRLIMKEQADL